MKFINDFNNLNCGIYCIKNLKNSKIYYGQSSNLKKRVFQHKHELLNGIHWNSYLQNSFTKHGFEVFEFRVLKECHIIELHKEEQIFLDKHAGKEYCYNISLESISPLKGKTGKKHPRFGIKGSEELRKRQSESRRGKNNGFYRCHWTPEMKSKWRESRKKKLKSVDQIDIKTGKIIATYGSLIEAYEATGAITNHIGECCRGEAKTAGGFKWQYTNKKQESNIENKESK